MKLDLVQAGIIILSIILAVIIGFSVYLDRQNKALKKAINSLHQAQFMIETNKNNLKLYNELRLAFSDCKIDENSFIVNRINFEWGNIDFINFIARLNELYRDNTNLYLINNLKVSLVKDQKTNKYNINGSLVIPCK